MGKRKETKEERLARKQAQKRTEQERLNEVEPALTKLLELGIPEDIPGVKRFYEVIEDYINTGTSFTGIIKVPELKREFQCLLSNDRKHKVTIVFANMR
jgi:hypothetical protein